VVVKYLLAVACNYYYNSRIYYKFCHYCYHYFAFKKGDEGSPCPDEAEDVLSRKNLVNLEDYLEQQDIINVIGTSGTLSKYPKHIGFSILNFHEDLFSTTFKHNENNNKKQLVCEDISKDAADNKQLIGEKEVRAICKLICWSWMAQARVVSLYDYDGLTEEIPSKLKSCLHQEIEKTIQILKKCHPKLLSYYQHLPKIYIHEVGHESSRTVESTAASPSDTELHVCIFSRRHGKRTILNTVNTLARRRSLPSSATRRLSSFSEASSSESPDGYDPHGHHRRSELKESKVNAVLSQSLYSNVERGKGLASTNTGLMTEPDLLLILGNLKSTMGFMPWNLRLTEIHWIAIPNLLRLDSQDFIAVLQKYSKSQQRFGT
jgi:undecaprenyl pyrophosphate synthase